MRPTSEFIREVIRACGGASKIAEARGVLPSAVNNWPLRRQIPADCCPSLEKLSLGRFRCEQMRPDVEWSVLRASGAEGFSRVDSGL
ncbi:YdaS family helix-turn-helix protein [Chromobacterium vaccinii]|uniref:YdaS family helix-turn-helix protein n=1 Tax=Chromobacterium vaccinii TaxID=1108595 RepID=UPI003CD04F6F